MKLWATIGALMSLFASTPLPPEPSVEREERAGHAIEGPGFYVWDEDAREAEAWARELASAAARRND